MLCQMCSYLGDKILKNTALWKTEEPNYRSYTSSLKIICTKTQKTLRRFKARGGRLQQRRLTSLEELVGHYDIACNCSGCGAKELCQDITVAPIKGQVFKVGGRL